MTDGTFLSLKNWQACLAIAQQRLANPSFRLEIQQSIDSTIGPSSINGQAIGLTVQVMDTGKDLIKLSMTLDGDLKAAGKTIQVKKGVWEIITSFETVLKDEAYSVLPKLDDQELSVNFKAEGLAMDAEAVIIAILQKWIASRIQTNPFELFSFNANTGQGAGAEFTDFKVTSAYAKYSPEYSSFLLLMRETQGADVENDLVIDPHVLPQAQTAVLWVTHDLLGKTGGAALVQAAEMELTFRPKPMGVDIPQVSAPIRRWSQTIIDNVSIPGGFNFTSMQMSQPGLMLSATPLSISEFDAFTATDVTRKPKNLVQEQAEKLFQDCVYYFMEDNYRKYLLDAKKPTLPKEVLEVAEKQSKWYAEFARLQLAQAIKNSDAIKQDPFKGINGKKVDEKLKEMSLSETYADQTGRLYSLAFCLVHPRISLYMEDPNKWRQRYVDYVCSDAYADALMENEEPANKIHEDNAKLTVFDLSGKTSQETLPMTMAVFMRRVGDLKWQLFVKEQPDDYKTALTETLNAMVVEADKKIVSYEASGESTKPEDVQNAEDIKNAIDKAGGVAALSAAMMTLVAHEALQEGFRPLDRAMNRLEQLWADHPQQMAVGLRTVQLVSSVAVLVVFFIGIKNSTSTKGLTKEETAKLIVSFATQLVGAIMATGEIIALLNKVAPRVMAAIGQVLIRAIGAVSTRFAQGATAMVRSAAAIAKVMGAVLAFAAAALSIWEAIDDFDAGKVGEGVVDVLLAATAVLTGLAIALSWSGPVALVIAAIGFILALIRIFAFKSDESDAMDAAKGLTGELVLDGVAA